LYRRAPGSNLKSAIILLLAFAAASSVHAASTVPTPVIDSVTPSVITASLSPQTITVTGHDFLTGASVQAVPSVVTGATNLAQSVTVVSSTKITFTVQCLPTETAAVKLQILNPNGREYGFGAMTMQAQLSDLTPIILDTTGDSSGADSRDVTTTVRARVAPHSTATLAFEGVVPVPYFAYLYEGIQSATDDDGDGVVAFHALATAPGNILFVVADSTGGLHKTKAPFQEALPDSNWFSPAPHPERSPDGTMSRYDYALSYEALFMWVRPGVGSWYVFAADHNATDADGVPSWDNHAVLRAAAFQPVAGTASGPPPSWFAPSDIMTILSERNWFIERLPSPLTGSTGGEIRLFFDTTKEGTDATIYVRRIAGSEGTVTVSYHTVDASARAGVDYVAKTGTVTFAPGEYVKTISISTIDDGFYGNGYRTLSLAVSADAATVPVTSYTVAISDAQDPPAVSAADVRVNEGDAASATVQVPVTLTGKTRLPASLSWYTVDDHQNFGPPHPLTFAAGETQKFITVPYTGNTTPGPDRTITVHLQSPENVTFRSSTAVVTIVDDDTQSLSVDDIRAEEQGETATFLVTMSRATGTPVTVHYATVDGTATAPFDYAATSGVLTFAAGEIAKSVTIVIVPDRVVDPDETFTLRLSDATGATISKSSGTATIIESDRPPEPVVLVDDIVVAEGNSGTTDATFNVRLSFASTIPVIVAWKTENGSARDDSDYTAGIGTLTFAPGETVHAVTVKISGDTTAEPNENFRLVIIGASNATAGSGASCTIVNDDAQPPPPRRRPSH
jgi:hypothetical protein